MLKAIKRLWCEEEAQGMAEYGLILALIAIVVIVALGPLGEAIRDRFTDVTNSL
jgi:pilus assembly protein Flp/PilA